MNNDLISREDVEKIILSEVVDLQDGTEEWRTYVNETCENILNKVHNAPTVTPDMAQVLAYESGKSSDRPKGKWIIDGHHIRCNRCNEYTCDTDREGDKIPNNFCPNCGADMREVDNEEDTNLI